MMQTSTHILPAVAGAIFNEKGEILLQKRRDVNQWCIPSGHVEFGESVDNALLREIKEETTAQAKIIRFIGVYSSAPWQVYTYGDKVVHYVTSYFEARLLSDIPAHFSNEETKELRFFNTDELPQLAQLHPSWLSDALNAANGPFVR